MRPRQRKRFGALLFALIALGMSAPANPQGGAPDARRSGFDMMSAELQAMQRDDASNPGLLWVREGASLWREKTGSTQRACADCHGDAADSMRGAAARYPVIDAASAKPIDLAGRILQCRVERQEAPALARESRALLALTTYVATQSRGAAIAPDKDPRMEQARALGGALYQTRMGQLNLACAACHDGQAGKRLGGSVIPQAHPTGYPIYRLEWQQVGSLQRRLRNCMIGVRAEPFAYGSDEFIALEAFLMSRAAGMAIETPAVRP